MSVTVLGNGTLLVAGGSYGDGAQASAWLYDPKAQSWLQTGSMAQDRVGHAATLLSDGRVLVTGGSLSVFPESMRPAELYDATSGTWSAAAPMEFPREHATATLLDDGSVLVTGGHACGIAERYDPRSDTWRRAGTMLDVTMDHTATLLDDGRVLVAGGRQEVFPPDPTDPCYEERAPHPGETASPGGPWDIAGYLVFGYAGIATAEVYDPGANAWSRADPMTATRAGATASRLSDGTVLVAGGYFKGIIPAAEVFDPVSGHWRETGSMATPRGLFSATLLPDGSVLAAGGCDGFRFTATAERYDPAAGVWRAAGSMRDVRCNHDAVLTDEATVVIPGQPTAPVETYDPETNSWR
jgi:hypothetical protein